MLGKPYFLKINQLTISYGNTLKTTFLKLRTEKPRFLIMLTHTDEAILMTKDIRFLPHFGLKNMC